MKSLYTLYLCCLFSLPSMSLWAQCHGGTVNTANGETFVYACIDDGDSDFIGFTNNSTANLSYAYIVTNEQNEVLAIPSENFLDFENAGLGTCLVYGLSYTGDLLITLGDFLVTDFTLSTGCYSLSDNYVSVVRALKESSTVMTLTGATTVEIEDNEIAVVEYIGSPVVAAEYMFVITRSDEKIISINDTGSFDFATFDEGKYFIWGYSYYGDFLLEQGDYLTGNVATACFTKSTNFILVKKEIGSSLVGCQADGARVKTSSGATTEYACVNDGDGDYIGFLNTSIVNSNYQYLVTDENNIILAIPENNFVNFENVPPGVCRVWGVAYQGDLEAEVGGAASELIATGCLDLSDNFITVIRTTTEATTISTTEGEEQIEILDNTEAMLNFVNSGTGISDYIYFITDAGGQIFGQTTDGNFDFAALGEAKYFVWGYSYAGNILLEIGDELTGSISDGCFTKSTNVVLVKKRVDAIVPEPCIADAGTMTIDANPVMLVGGMATISATGNGDINIPTDIELIYVLTSGDDVVVQMFASIPSFTVTEAGLYTLHTLVAELNDINADQYFDASGIIIGETTGNEILSMIEAQDVCADFDLVGASVIVEEEQGCIADAGFLFADQPQVPVQFFTIIMANHVIVPTVPVDFELNYLLLTTDNGIILGRGDNPVFLVEAVGTYTILTLVAETSDPLSPDYFDLSSIDLGNTSLSDLATTLEGLGICYALDQVGAQIMVIDASDATVTRSAEVGEQEVETIRVNELQLFPNPTQDFLQIQWPTATTDQSTWELRITDLSGRQLIQQTIENQQLNSHLKIEVNHLPSGLYQLSLFNHQEQWVQQFYKQ